MPVPEWPTACEDLNCNCSSNPRVGLHRHELGSVERPTEGWPAGVISGTIPAEDLRGYPIVVRAWVRTPVEPDFTETQAIQAKFHPYLDYYNGQPDHISWSFELGADGVPFDPSRYSVLVDVVYLNYDPPAPPSGG